MRAKQNAGHNGPAFSKLCRKENDQPAAAVFFFTIARLISSARGDSSASWLLSRNASRPPRWSTDLIALAETRSFTERPSASEISVTLHRFGRNRRLVLMFEWLTLWPTCGPFGGQFTAPSHDEKSFVILGRSRCGIAAGGSNLKRPFQERRTYKGACPKRQGRKRPVKPPSAAGLQPSPAAAMRLNASYKKRNPAEHGILHFQPNIWSARPARGSVCV